MFNLPISSKFVGSVFVLAILLCSYVTPAAAAFKPVGFEWVAPDEAPPPPLPSSSAVPPAMQAQPLPSSGAVDNPEVISPVVIQGQQLAPLSSPSSQAASSQPMPTLMAPPQPSPNMQAASVMPTGDVVHGFANKVPLAVALRQILPPGYGFSVDPNVDLGTLVSFRGGLPWRDTLQNMLQPEGLSMHEQGQMVSIGHANEVAETTPMPAPASARVVQPPAAETPMLQPLPSPNLVMPLASAPHMLEPPPSNIMPIPDQGLVQAQPAAHSIVDTWNANRSDSLRKVLEGWCQRAGVEFDWLAEYDYPLQASVNYTGTFEEAVRNLLAGFQDAHPEPIAELHENPGLGQVVLVIQTRGNNYSD